VTLSRPARLLTVSALAAALALPPSGVAAASPDRGPGSGGPKGPAKADTVRFATFNVSMFRTNEGELAADLADPDDEAQDVEVRNVAEIIQRQRPDVLLLNELDVDLSGRTLADFQENFLEVGQGGAEPIRYAHSLVLDSNTGVASGFDLNNDGQVGTSGRAYGDDAFGFGEFEGQYGFAVLSRYPIDERAVRTFQDFRWADMPGARLPDDPSTPEPADWFTPEELEVVRLSSKNHADVPIRIGRRTVHVLASHPTPPSFDGPEDRNGRRNADEIRLWADYVSPGKRSAYLVDDDGRRGGLRPGSPFVVMGDLNADASDDGNGLPGAAEQIVDHPLVRDPLPRSAGAAEASRLQGGVNTTHRGDPALDTADFSDGPGSGGNLRVDYVLPSRPLQTRVAGVFWPVLTDPLSRLTGVYDPTFTNGFPSSDHRMVWADLKVPGARR
jgi:hypothetical protein